MAQYYKLPKVLPPKVEPIPLTPETWQHLKRKQVQLIKQREETQERVNEARAQGDLSENGAYKYGKMELGNIGRQQREVNYLLKHGYVITDHPTDKVGFGSRVTVQGPKGKQTFMLVSEYEADPKLGKLSKASPLGSTLWGKNVGAKLSVITPAGEQQFTVIAIH